MLKNSIVLAIFLCCSVMLYAQKDVSITGIVQSEQGEVLDLVNISVQGKPGGTISKSDGTFAIFTKAVPPYTLVFSSIGYQTAYITFSAESQKSDLLIKLRQKDETIEEVNVQAKRKNEQNFEKIDAKLSAQLPDATGGSIEALVKTQMGVSNNNELSSQYRVRGGNFDENLVYVNDIEVYRPFLIRSGQQEGLSFVNPEMVSDIRFSAGGFDARYGDKMSSVLDITYKRPTEFGGSASASLLGANAHIEGASKDDKFTHISGVRYKTNSYLLGSLDVSGDYNPTFLDLQTYLTYQFNDKWGVSFLGNVSQNTYNFKPVDRETTFGTLSEVKTLRIYFEGEEKDDFLTGFMAGTLNFSPNKNNSYKLILSGFRTSENENFDILGQYWIQDLESEDGTPSKPEDSATGIGVGSYLEHARNYLFGTVRNVAVRGKHRVNKHRLEWEGKYQHERFSDQINEWVMRDSAGYSIPISDPELVLSYAYNATHDISSNRVTGFLQDNMHFDLQKGKLDLAIGIRASYWDFNNEFLLSPRASVLYDPMWEKDYRFKFATGVYYQSPFYKEYRAQGVGINYDIKSQKSIHFVTGFDHYFSSWGRPFKYSTELYYKHMTNLNPYTIDNVRIRYTAQNNAKGYAAGIDMKINGEFVKGVESWASLSIMQTEEDILDDSYVDKNTGETVYPGYIPRPSDQRINFSLMFQDYLPNNPSFKVNLNLVFGTGLPFGPPRSERYLATARMPAYRRVDIGFSKELTGVHKNPNKADKIFKNLWLGLEVFNLFDIDNTISYYWVSDVNNRQYAVPNYLTSRRVNVKLVSRF
ncbi:TonB-dependent receptor [Saccharicrinis aurantiacus]|uniref:TonB-dependent receptor n=1 Tax=Saccharicrinis aurantiacus TaxID=1849719 RepID=UPI002490E326|nr:TonB-dependent receptor [Saccharicrinis aurantiacus]